MSISEQLTHSTIRIECVINGGQISTGTGFLFNFLQQGEVYVPTIVTNKHVVEGSISGSFRFTMADDNGNPLYGQHKVYNISDFQNVWIPHPDPNVDLCIMPTALIFNQLTKEGIKVFHKAIDKSLIFKQDELDNLTALEDVIMIGYPNGLWDTVNNLPIIRKGITATHPRFNFNSKEEFLIDAACFPGSSGSPVFLFNPSGYTDNNGKTMLGAPRIKLLGILYAGTQHTVTGEIRVINIPVRQEQIALSGIPNNLGFIIKAYKLFDFEPILEKRLALE